MRHLASLVGMDKSVMSTITILGFGLVSVAVSWRLADDGYGVRIISSGLHLYRASLATLNRPVASTSASPQSRSGRHAGGSVKVEREMFRGDVIQPRIERGAA